MALGEMDESQTQQNEKKRIVNPRSSSAFSLPPSRANSHFPESFSQHLPLHSPRKLRNYSRYCCFSSFNLLQEVVKSEFMNDHFPHFGAETVKMKFLSYNLFIRPPGIMNNSNDYKDERLHEFIKEMSKFDIIGLQEVFSAYSSRQQELINKAYTQGFYYYIRSPSPYSRMSIVDGGLLLLSKYPIEEKDYITFTLAMQSDALAAKGVLYGKIQIASQPQATVHVFVTHTQASYANSEVTKNQLVRKSQLLQLRDFISRKTANDHLPVVILGDLNVNARRAPDCATDSDEYLGMIDVFQSLAEKYTVYDTLKEKTSTHPITFADTWVEHGRMFPRETQLTDHTELCTMQRLDYVIYLEPKVVSLEHRFEIESSCVMPFFVEKRPFTQLSDHYGVQAVMRYRYTPNGNGAA
eukprot:TRINITY_DN1082_c0_g2_i1.p1 TRINITY_DN1082_c0_g2~~TRINITY_DN1082_c0_g2_i1.p1  ORF type:complete len:410 (+),score=58.72 TRINITY_DN1082_c0_g2_i1:53-1282(+)